MSGTELIGYKGKTYSVSVKTLENGVKMLLIAGTEETAYPRDMRELARLRAESAGLI